MRWTLKAGLGLVAAAALSAGGVVAKDGFSLDAPPKAAFIYYAEKADGGWVQSFDDARVRLESELKMKIPYVEHVGDNETEIRPAVERTKSTRLLRQVLPSLLRLRVGSWRDGKDRETRICRRTADGHCELEY
jgi:basic membrane lipoprotein Med (substrate-binding protein (PBP1-ABC) superfamily)